MRLDDNAAKILMDWFKDNSLEDNRAINKAINSKDMWDLLALKEVGVLHYKSMSNAIERFYNMTMDAIDRDTAEMFVKRSINEEGEPYYEFSRFGYLMFILDGSHTFLRPTSKDGRLWLFALRLQMIEYMGDTFDRAFDKVNELSEQMHSAKLEATGNAE